MSETKTSAKAVTIISRSAPYDRDSAFTCLDLALAYSVFNQTVNYLFVGDGVLQLIANQQPEQIGSKNLSASLGALEVYGVENIFVDKQGLVNHGLTLEDLVIKPQVIDENKLKQLVSNSSTVYSL